MKTRAENPGEGREVAQLSMGRAYVEKRLAHRDHSWQQGISRCSPKKEKRGGTEKKKEMIVCTGPFVPGGLSRGKATKKKKKKSTKGNLWAGVSEKKTGFPKPSACFSEGKTLAAQRKRENTKRQTAKKRCEGEKKRINGDGGRQGMPADVQKKRGDDTINERQGEGGPKNMKTKGESAEIVLMRVGLGGGSGALWLVPENGGKKREVDHLSQFSIATMQKKTIQAEKWTSPEGGGKRITI